MNSQSSGSNNRWVLLAALVALLGTGAAALLLFGGLPVSRHIENVASPAGEGGAEETAAPNGLKPATGAASAPGAKPAPVAKPAPGAKPELVAEIMRQIPADYPPEQVTEEAAQKLAARDLRAALAWAEGLPEAASQKRALAVAIAHWAKSDREAALNFAVQKKAQLPAAAGSETTDPLELGKVIDAEVAAWLQADGAKAIAWAKGVTDPQVRAEVLRGIAISLEALPPSQSAPLAMELPADYRTPIVTDIAFRWATREMPGAIAWVGALPEDALKVSTTRSVAVVLLQEDPAQMSRWLETLQPSPSRDEAVEVFVQGAGEWLRVDKAAATKWIRETAVLPAEGKEKILGPE